MSRLLRCAQNDAKCVSANFIIFAVYDISKLGSLKIPKAQKSMDDHYLPQDVVNPAVDGPPPQTIFGLENEFGISWPDFSRTKHHSIIALDSAQAADLFVFYYYHCFSRPSPFSLAVTPGYRLSIGQSDWLSGNGSKVYLDVGHPEYSTPECADPRSAALWAKAGEYLFEIILRGLNKKISRLDAESLKEVVLQKNRAPLFYQNINTPSALGPIRIYKNNIDILGNTFGFHENYLCQRQAILSPVKEDSFLPLEQFNKLRYNLLPFLITRQIFSGSGGFWKDPGIYRWHYVLSPRAMDTKELVGTGITTAKPCISSKDEPHADRFYFRVHIVCGDPLMSEFATYLSLGTTSIILSMIQDGWLDRQIVFGCEIIEPKPDGFRHAASAREIIRYFKKISRDYISNPSFAMHVHKKGYLTAWEIQNEYFELAQAYFIEVRKPCWWEKDIMQKWEMILRLLKNNAPEKTRFIEWASKYDTLQKILVKKLKDSGVNIKKPNLRDQWLWMREVAHRRYRKEKIGNILLASAIQYSDLSKKKGLYWALARNGEIERLFTEYEIKQAIRYPPRTRAFLREYARQFVKRYGIRLEVHDWGRFSVVEDRTIQTFPYNIDSPFGGENIIEEIERLEHWFKVVVEPLLSGRK